MIDGPSGVHVEAVNVGITPERFCERNFGLTV
jgi:hypothetical protein